jgi:hypothetical protein
MQLSLDSNTAKVYVIDTSALIKLDADYPKHSSIFESIWKDIEELIDKGQLKTLQLVKDEIEEYQGAHTFLKEWMRDSRTKLVADLDAGCINAAKPIIAAEYNTGFFNKEKQAEGKEEADVFLIAYSKVHSCSLITNEGKLKPNKIPAVAAKNGVRCLNVAEFLAERGFRMVKGV